MHPEYCIKNKNGPGCQLLFQTGVSCAVECTWLFLAVAVTAISLLFNSEFVQFPTNAQEN